MKQKLSKIFEQMNSLHVVVLGDVMLDNYYWGEAERMSPEAPVPVVSVSKKESRLGGAANVALNCRALGAKVTLASVIGDDAAGDAIIQLAAKEHINTDLIHKSSERPTTTKTRIIARHQQMLRIDDEDDKPLTVPEEHPFLDALLRFLQKEKPQVLIFEDYNKGVLKENIIQRVMAHCREIGIITAVDPKKEHFFAYKGCTIFKPNLKEVREALHTNTSATDIASLSEAHNALHTKLQHDITFITLSEHGVFYHSGASQALLPGHVRNIADVSGAGDTVIATAAMIYALTGDADLMASVANTAGGLVCEQIGVVQVDKARLLAEAAL